MIKLGYSLGAGKNPKYPLKERIKMLLSVENYGAELNYRVVTRLNEKLDDQDLNRLKKFQHLSIHAPSIWDSKKREVVKYSDANAEKVLLKILDLAQKTQAQAIVFHPDLIDDFGWLNQRVGSLLAIENMDAAKSFGNTIKDLEKVFSKLPNAKWVCDLNHLYTLDRTMKLADEFHQAFKTRLSYYHVSGYGGSHDCFCNSGEDIILEGIKNLTLPLIHEGMALRGDKALLLKENEYILSRLKKLMK